MFTKYRTIMQDADRPTLYWPPGLKVPPPPPHYIFLKPPLAVFDVLTAILLPGGMLPDLVPTAAGTQLPEVREVGSL